MNLANADEPEIMYADEVEERLRELIEEQFGWHWDLHLAVASECAWSAKLQITRIPDSAAAGPDLLFVTDSGGHLGPDHAASAAYGDMIAWLEKREQNDRDRAR